MDKITTEQLEEILERVEEGTTTSADADMLRNILTCSVCEWKLDTPNCYETECGNVWQFFADGPAENGQVFCGYCGGKIVECDTLPEPR